MANILEKYGIKEVADVTFYQIDSNGKPSYPVLYLDTLKVSTIEQTADSTDAQGGKGNAALITWDYNKAINVTLEDALFSARSLSIMFGDEATAIATTGTATNTTSHGGYRLMKTESFVASAAASATTDAIVALQTAGWNSQFVVGGSAYDKKNPKVFAASNGATVTASSVVKDGVYFVTYDVEVEGGYVIDISADTFPGTYYIVGDTYARSATSGKDEFFQFIIPKAKVTSENTITLEASGDPSVFNLNLKVLRPNDGVMMKLVKYDLVGSANNAVDSAIYHNHDLAGFTS